MALGFFFFFSGGGVEKKATVSGVRTIYPE